MKQRIITGALALAFFVPIVIFGGPVFTTLIYLIATIGVYEILRMKGIKLFSFAGIVSMLLLFILLLPSTIATDVLDVTGHTKIEWLFVAIFLLLNLYSFGEKSFYI